MGEDNPEVPLAWSYLMEELRSIRSLLHPLPDSFIDENDFLRPVPLLLSSVWEVYATRSAEEAAAYLGHFTKNPDDLPTNLRRSVSKDIKNDKHELAAWDLAGDRWRARIAERAKIENRRLISGKAPHVDEHFEYTLGISEVSKHWKSRVKSSLDASEQLTDFIKRRDEIIHRGEIHLSREECWLFYELIEELAIRTAHVIDKHIKCITQVRYCTLSMKKMRERAALDF